MLIVMPRTRSQYYNTQLRRTDAAGYDGISRQYQTGIDGSRQNITYNNYNTNTSSGYGYYQPSYGGNRGYTGTGSGSYRY